MYFDGDSANTNMTEVDVDIASITVMFTETVVTGLLNVSWNDDSGTHYISGTSAIDKNSITITFGQRVTLSRPPTGPFRPSALRNWIPLHRL